MVHGGIGKAESQHGKPAEGIRPTGIEPVHDLGRQYDKLTTNQLEALALSQILLSKPPFFTLDHDTPSTNEDVPRVTQLDIDPAAQMWLMVDRLRGVKP
jgi:hypothetical protein